ncbi:MAG: DUF4411 family protein [Methanobrevibacter sp.]|jgi:hypothetical protein|nr:DUF4411 family protein [Candidatus Methanoflexus mossambicus]
MKYVIDTSAILAGSQYEVYEKQYFNEHWKNFDKLIDEGILISTKSVYMELIAKDDDMSDWAKTKINMFKEIDDKVLEYGILYSDFYKKYKWSKKRIFTNLIIKEKTILCHD